MCFTFLECFDNSRFSLFLGKQELSFKLKFPQFIAAQCIEKQKTKIATINDRNCRRRSLFRAGRVDKICDGMQNVYILNPNKAGLFEGSFFLGGQFGPPFMFYKELAHYQYNY